MDDIIRKAKERIKALTTEQAELETLVDAYERLAERFGSYEPEPVIRHVRIPSLASSVRDILLENGSPMKLEPLFEEWGSRFPGAVNGVSQRNFGKRLWTIRDKIKYIQGEGYWPVEPPDDGEEQEPAEIIVLPVTTTPEVSAPVMMPAPIVRRTMEPLEHYSVLAEDCDCYLCDDWRVKRDALTAAMATVHEHSKGYGVSCSCANCKAMWKARGEFMAVENKKNLVCEIAYHVENNREFNRDGQAIMDRLRGELDNPTRTTNWWADSGGKFPLGYWFRKVCVVASGTVSAVIVASGMAGRPMRVAV